MEFTIHQQVLTIVFVVALIMGAIANKTNFCTMGAVSDWVNMGTPDACAPGCSPSRWPSSAWRR